MQETEESAAEPEPERLRRLRLVVQARVVQLQPLERIPQLLELVGVRRVEAGEHDGLRFLVAREHLLRPAIGVEHGVPDLCVGDPLDLRRQVPDLAGGQLVRRLEAEPKEPHLVDLVDGLGLPEADPHPGPDRPVHDPDEGDRAPVLVVHRVEDERPQRRVGIAPRRGDPGHDRLEDRLDPGPFLGGREQDFVGVDPHEVGDLVTSALGLGGRQVDLVDDGDDLEAGVQGEEQVRDRLGFHSLRGVDDEEGSFAGLQAPAHRVGEVDVSRGVDQVQLVLAPVRGLVRHPDRVQLDRDAPLALELHRVEDLLLHLPPVHGARPLEEPIGERRLPVVDVGDNGEVPDPVQWHERSSRSAYFREREYRRRPGGRQSASGLDLETVERRLDAGGEFRGERGVVEPVRQVREVRALRREALDRRERLLDVEVRGVRRIVPQRVDDEGPGAREKRHGVIRDPLPVDDHGEVPAPEPVAPEGPVRKPDRRQAEPGGLDRLAVGEREEIQLRHDRARRTDGVGPEEIREPPLQLGRVLRREMERETSAAGTTQRAEIVDPVQVIGVRVREEYRVERLDPGGDQLEAELRRRVHEKAPRTVGQQQRLPCPAVPGIVRAADRAAAPDDRDAEGRARAEESELQDAPFKASRSACSSWCRGRGTGHPP